MFVNHLYRATYLVEYPKENVEFEARRLKRFLGRLVPRDVVRKKVRFDMKAADVEEFRFTECSFYFPGDRATIEQLTFRRCVFRLCMLSGVQFEQTVFEGCEFRLCDFSKTLFRGCVFRDCILSGCSGYDVSFESTEISAKAFLGALEFPYSQYRMAIGYAKTSSERMNLIRECDERSERWRRSRVDCARRLLVSNDQCSHAHYADEALVLLRRFEGRKIPYIFSLMVTSLERMLLLAVGVSGVLMLVLYCTGTKYAGLEDSGVCGLIASVLGVFFLFGFTNVQAKSGVALLAIVLAALVGVVWNAALIAGLMRRWAR